jgi:hypothetical protein
MLKKAGRTDKNLKDLENSLNIVERWLKPS